MTQHRTIYRLRLRSQKNGEEHDRLIFAKDEATARERAVVRARRSLGSTMAERAYGKFDVLNIEKVEGKPTRY
jgi:hypothetical protein